MCICWSNYVTLYVKSCTKLYWTYPATALSCLLVTTWIKSSILWTVARSTDRRSPPRWRARLIDGLFTVTASVMLITLTHIAARQTIWWSTLHGSVMAWIVTITDLVTIHSNASWTPVRATQLICLHLSVLDVVFKHAKSDRMNKLRTNINITSHILHHTYYKLILHLKHYFTAAANVRRIPGWQRQELAFQLLMQVLLSSGHRATPSVSHELVTLQPAATLWVSGSDRKMPRPVPTRISYSNNKIYHIHNWICNDNHCADKTYS